MNSSLYIGATGMKGLAEGMHVTTNNIANISTIGFKQQDMLFSDVLYQTQASMGNWWNAQEDSRVAVGQVGMGLAVEAVRTRYGQGPIESTNTLTDMAINGKGFFQVTDGANTYYTRAGDFRQDNEGVWRLPAGYALCGYQINENGERGALSQVQVDKFQTMKPKSSTSLDLVMNLYDRQDLTAGSENPYFSLLDSYDASRTQPMEKSCCTATQQMTLYDAEGNPRTVTAYFDGAPSSGSNRYSEFIIAAEPTERLDEDGNLITPESGDGLLMSGVLEFDSAGNLINVAAFTPSVAGSKNLEDWVPASFENGSPTFNLDGTDVALNFGITSASGWDADVPENAAQIGADIEGMPRMTDITRAEFPTTAFATSSSANSYKQNGYAEGFLSNVSINENGIVTGTFSNGQNQDLWEIPVCRFTSEDGLRREGSNLFSATEESGAMEMGMAGTENYGTIQAYNIENSNVDLAEEMVSMIINQRGFQSNSKVVTTADQMLQKAMELKR